MAGDPVGYEPGGGGGGSSLPDLSPDPSGTVDNPASVTVDKKGRVTSATAGQAPQAAARKWALVESFVRGGSIGPWQVVANLHSVYVVYFFGGSVSLGQFDTPICRAGATAQTVKLRFDFDSANDLNLTVRKSSGADLSSWSTVASQTLDANGTSAEISVSLQAGEALGLYVQPTGTVSLNYWYVYLEV